jgi:orotidine-5'-phosphate decarboxylase
MERFGQRMRAALDGRGPLCVGLDPHPALLAAWGLPDDVNGLRAFSETVVRAVGPLAAAVKPQSAFFERHGAGGISVLESTIRQLRDAGTLVILDVKRGDIGSTAAAYADAYLGPGAPLAADAITVSPYLGFGSLRPMIDAALSANAGIFVLARTSNPEGGDVQLARLSDGRSVAQAMIDEISQLNAGVRPLGDVGAVIGITTAGDDLELSTVGGPVLAPGLGAQGARASDLVAAFGSIRRDVLPVSARDILSHGPDPAALRAAVTRTLDDVRRFL